jgi:thioredoxin-related protein
MTNQQHKKGDTPMRKILTLICIAAALAACFTAALAEKPAPAKDVLAAAVKTATSSDKAVMLIFHASWCGWCHKLDTTMADAEFAKVIGDNYVVTHLDVLEAKKVADSLENPGGNEMLKNLGGEKAGIPYMVFFDGKGTKIADSNIMPKKQNVGYPGSPEEIVAFEKLLRKTSKHMTDAQIAVVDKVLKEHAPKQSSAH